MFSNLFGTADAEEERGVDIPLDLSSRPRGPKSRERASKKALSGRTPVKKAVKQRGCEHCTLNEVPGVQKIMGAIFGRNILIVGQSPGPEENDAGKEFVGRSGEFLWEELKAVGISRKDCDVFNSVRCFPADATEGSYNTFLKMRSPTQLEIDCCSLHTDNMLGEVKAKHILILGQVAAKAFLKTRSLPVQKVFYSEAHKAILYLADHPAFFIRGYGQGDRLNAFRATLTLLAENLKGNDTNFHDPYHYIRAQDYRLVTTEKEALEAERIIRLYAEKGRRSAVDIEDDDVGDGRFVFAVGFCPKPGLSFVFDIRYEGVMDTVARILEDKTIRKVFQFGCSDVTKLRKLEGIRVRGFEFDTLLGEYFYQCDKKQFGLDDIAAARFQEFSGYKNIIIEDMLEALPADVKVPKASLKTPKSTLNWLSVHGFYNLSKLKPDTLRLYNGGDADLTKRIEVDLKKRPQVNMKLMQLYIDLSFLLLAMESNGPLFDYTQNDIVSKIYPKRAETLLSKLREMADDPEYNPASNPQVDYLIYEKFGLEFPFDGKRNTQKKTLLMLSKEHPFPGAQIAYRKAEKANSTYVVGYRMCADLNDGRLRTKWKAWGTRTGRLASGGKKEDPGVVNLQNVIKVAELQNQCIADRRWRLIYKVIRKIVRTYTAERVPALIEKWIRKNLPDLKTYLALDYGQVEVRVMAQLSGDKNLLHDCKSGDIHTTVGVAMTGWNADQIKNDNLTRTLTKNCLAEGTMVLTDRGLISIEKVTKQMLVWDGTDFVSHDGVVCQGIREVITYAGLTATPDHEVWLSAGEKVRFEYASKSRLDIAVTGNQEAPIRYTQDSIQGDIPKRTLSLRDNSMQEMQQEGGCVNRYPQERQQQKLCVSTKQKVCRFESTHSSGPVLCTSAAMRESEEPELGELRRKGNPEQIHSGDIRDLCSQVSPSSDLSRSGNRPREQQWPLRARQSATGNEAAECMEHPPQQNDSLSGKALTGNRGSETDEESRDGACNITRSSIVAAGYTVAGSDEEESTRSIRKAKVYDILNAGPNHRFTANGFLVSNCHFGIMFGISKKNLYNFIVAMTPPPKDEADAKAREANPITPERVAEMYDRYFARYKGVADFIVKQREFARANGYVETLFGLRQPLNVTSDEEDAGEMEMVADEDSTDRGTYWGNQAINGPVQGTAHQLMESALVNLIRRPADYKVLGIPQSDVHDALYMVVNVLDLPEALGTAKRLLEKDSIATVEHDFGVQWDVPIVTEAEAGLRLGCKVKYDASMSVGQFMLDWYNKCAKQEDDLKKELLKVTA